MIGQTLVLVCAALGLAAGSCLPLRTQCTSNIVLPEFTFGNGNSGCGMTSGLTTGFSGLEGNLLGNGFGNGFGNGLGNGLEGNYNGPETAPLPVVQAPSVTLPTVEAPLVTLSAPAVPAPRVLASRCVCTKTVVKPQVFQRVVTVPKVQRYFKRTVTPVVENLIYKSKPVTGNNGVGLVSGSGIVSGSGLVTGSGLVNGMGSGFVGSGLMGSGCGSNVAVHTSTPFMVSGNSNGRVC